MKGKGWQPATKQETVWGRRSNDGADCTDRTQHRNLGLNEAILLFS